MGIPKLSWLHVVFTSSVGIQSILAWLWVTLALPVHCQGLSLWPLRLRQLLPFLCQWEKKNNFWKNGLKIHTWITVNMFLSGFNVIGFNCSFCWNAGTLNCGWIGLCLIWWRCFRLRLALRWSDWFSFVDVLVWLQYFLSYNFAVVEKIVKLPTNSTELSFTHYFQSIDLNTYSANRGSTKESLSSPAWLYPINFILWLLVLRVITHSHKWKVKVSLTKFITMWNPHRLDSVIQFDSLIIKKQLALEMR